MHHTFSILVVGILLSFQSCTTPCTQVPCSSNSPIVIEFSGYSGNQEFIAERFFKNGQFDSLITWRREAVNLTTSNTWGAYFISPDYDYRFLLVSDSNQFEITDLDVDETVTTEKCGRVRTLEQLLCPWRDFKVSGSKANKVNESRILLSK